VLLLGIARSSSVSGLLTDPSSVAVASGTSLSAFPAAFASQPQSFVASSATPPTSFSAALASQNQTLVASSATISTLSWAQASQPQPHHHHHQAAINAKDIAEICNIKYDQFRRGNVPMKKTDM
jgi:hypothetical protein